MLCRLWKFPITADTEAAVAALPAFDFDPTGPCMEECSNCCLPGSLSPTVQGKPQRRPYMRLPEPHFQSAVACHTSCTHQEGMLLRRPRRHSSYSHSPNTLCPSLFAFSAAEICKQATPEGYTFYSKMDSSSYDITRATVTGDWASAAAACSANPYCLGTLTSGWMKYYLRNTTQWTTGFSDPCQGLLVKQGA